LQYKIKKQNREIVQLKSQLYDRQKNILQDIVKKIDEGNEQLHKNQQKTLESFIVESNSSLQKHNQENASILLQHGKETDRIL
jgi:hypothetical protein